MDASSPLPASAEALSTRRLPEPWGLLIDRSQAVPFTFEGRATAGLSGDTLASALIAENRWLLSRSFKYHRPRSAFSLGGHEADTLVQVGSRPNVAADRLPLTPGLVASAQNTLGGLERDVAQSMQSLSRFLPVGFYYHTFFRPKALWPLWERVIRTLAGLGRVDTKAYADHHADHGYDKAYLFADVVVVGAGAAGLSAALEANAAGAEVLVIDENPVVGGSLCWHRTDTDAEAERATRTELLARVQAQPTIRVLTNATCQGLFPDGMLEVTQGKRLLKVRGKRVIVSTGVIGQPAIFPGNDSPGVMHTHGVQRLMRLWGVRPGTRAVVLTADEDGYGCALDLQTAGVLVTAILDLRAESDAQGPLAEAARAVGIPVRHGRMVAEAHASADHLRAVSVAEVHGRGTLGAARERIPCDLLAVSVGVVPNGALIHHLGAPARYDATQHTFVLPATLPEPVDAAGSVRGHRSLAARLADGRRAGRAAAKALGLTTAESASIPTDPAGWTNHPWPMVDPEGHGKAFVDRDEDLTTTNIHDAVAAGFDHVQLLKRYSTAGMGPMQGRTAHLAVVRLAARDAGRPLDSATMTTLRPPVGGQTLGHLAGRSFDPTRLSPIHDRHVALGASFMTAGPWLRPAAYGKGTKAVTKEVQSVRKGVGLIDVSTLGKLEVRGPDAAEFLNRLYTFTYAKQQVGRCRYVLMCGDAGQVMDDGVAVRWADDHFTVTATTGGVDAVFRRMTWFQAQWRLKVDIANVTGAWAAVNLAGPRSRRVLAKLAPDLDLSREGFPYMGAREGTLAGIPARLLRVGFVGELGYEIHVPAGNGEALWDALMDAGAKDKIKPFGVEAQRVLRLEKGHVIIGQDTDGLSTPHEVAMTWAIAKKKPYYVGKAAVDALAQGPQDRVLVGFTLPAHSPLPKENHLVIDHGEIAGRVTSIADSPTLGHPIGLAFVPPAMADPGTTVDIRIGKDRTITATVTAPPFYDPDNARQDMDP